MTHLQTRERRPSSIPATRRLHALPAALHKRARRREMAVMEPTIRGIEISLHSEFACMSRLLRHCSRGRQLEEIHGLLDNALEEIQDLILEGSIQPWKGLRLPGDEPEGELRPDPIRVGVYSTTGNPLHWGDILSGLTVMAKARLDKVVYVVSDDGEHGEDLLPSAARRAAARDILAVFSPLMAFAELAHGGHFDPIRDISLLHDLNQGRRLDVYYIVCSAHRLAGQEVSPTRVREALSGSRDPEVLSALPYSVFRRLAGGGSTPTRSRTHSEGAIEYGFIESGLMEKGLM